MAVISPNMQLQIPVVGVDTGPAYATFIDASLNIIDSHNHSPGSGVQITPSGLNINASLSIQNQLLINIGGLTLLPQNVTPGNSTIYESGNDLFYVDGAGRNVQITTNGGVAGTPGSISNLTAPASASYVSANSTFVFQAAPLTAANLDAASIVLRTGNASSFGLTLSPPVTFASDYTITLPLAPASSKIMRMSSTGQITSDVDVDNSTMTLAGGNVITVANAGITTTQIAPNTILSSNIAVSTIVGSNIAAATIVGANIASNTIGSDNLTVPPSARSGFTTSAGTGSAFLISSVVVACSGTKDVFFSGNGFAAATYVLSGGTGIINMQLDGVMVSSYTMTPGTFYPPSSFIGYASSISAGNHTFSIVGTSSAGQNINWTSAGMYAFEIR